MGMMDSLKRKFGMGPDPTISLTDSSFGIFDNYGEPAEVPMRLLINYLKTDVQFRLAVMTYTAQSAGNGYYNSADESTPAGRKSLEIVNDFAEDWNLDKHNITTAMEGWATGNSFDHFTGAPEKPFGALYKVPISTIVRIKRDEAGVVNAYVQQTNQGYYTDIPPEEIGHFRFMDINQNAFGEGLGQIMARDGMGYTTQAGKTVKRPSFFKINEFLADASAKLVYYGVPRFLFTPKEDGVVKEGLRKDIEQSLNKLDIGQHISTTFPADLKSVSLDTQNRFDSLFRNITESRFAGLMTPIDRLWSLNSFNYASSKEATNAMLPLVDMFQREHKRYIEQNIYAPLIIQDGRDPRKANVRLTWGEVEKQTLTDIRSAFWMLKQPHFADKFNPDDFIGMLQDIGFKLTEPQHEKQAIEDSLNALRKVMSIDRKKITMDKLESEIAEEKLIVLRRLKSYGR